MSPTLQGSGDILFFPLRPSVGLCVCLSGTKSCPLYNLITVTDISNKLHTFVKHIETMCHAQEPYLLLVYFSNYPPCNISSYKIVFAL